MRAPAPRYTTHPPPPPPPAPLATRRTFPATSKYLLAPTLRLLASLYATYNGARHFFYRQGVLRSLGLPCPVISIGNLTNGGTGKTPFVEYLSRHYSLSHRMPTMILQVRRQLWWAARAGWAGCRVDGLPFLACAVEIAHSIAAAQRWRRCRNEAAAALCRPPHMHGVCSPLGYSTQRGGGTVDETVMLQHLLEGLPVVVSDRATSSAEAREYLR